MHEVRGAITESRAETDKSLDAERAVTDVARSGTPEKRRMLDDLIENDRLKADERLLKFRLGTDRSLAKGRALAPPIDSTDARQRRSADEERMAERAEADALVGRERRRGDMALAAERQEHEIDHAQMEARREETNLQLISERNRADTAVAALSDSKDSLARVEGEQVRDRDVLSMVAHDLRSPLSIIAGNGEYICDVAQDPVVRQAADDVRRAAARMERLVSDLLDVARIDAGTFTVIRCPHDLQALTRDTVKEYQPLFASRDMTLTVAPGLVGPIEASIDHDRVVQVLSNLLGNAMKFGGGGGNVEVGVERMLDQVVFKVSDDGPGIASHEIPHLFKRFWKIDDDARRGLGLGLSICQSIVGAHGGRMWVETELGEGSAFFFSLPASPIVAGPLPDRLPESDPPRRFP